MILNQVFEEHIKRSLFMKGVQRVRRLPKRGCIVSASLGLAGPGEE